ncbi:MAG: T9SS type B sorting domain-containing protein [Bacteroidia bacterium]
MINKYKIFFLFFTLAWGNYNSVAQKLQPSTVALNNSIARTEANTDAYVNYIENKGQWCDTVLYQGDFYGGRIFLEKNALTYLFYPPGGAERMHPHANANRSDFRSCTMTFQAVRMEFLNSMPASIEGADKKTFYSNYFNGNDSRRWASGARAFGSVNYNNLYPGISVKVFSDMSNVRYDIVAEPHANLSQLKLRFSGHNSLSMKEDKLMIHTEIGDIAQARPVAYQEKNGSKVNVDCQFTLHDDIVSFEVSGDYDASLPLVIDPTLVFSTFTGSKADNWGMSATYDAIGNAYTSGICFGQGYPTTTGAYEVTFQGGGTGGGNWYGGFDIVVSKFNPTGTTLLYSTYLGGSNNEEPFSLIVDNENNLLVLGRTYSTNFPTTKGAYSRTLSGGADLIITKFDSAGKLLASTYVGGSEDDGVNISALEDSLGLLKYNYADDGRSDINVDDNNDIYVASCTSSSNFPVTAGAYQTGLKGMQDGCVFKINSGLTTLLWSTYLGGSAYTAAYNVALNSGGDVYVVGGTNSPDFPTTPGTLNPVFSDSIDGFIVHLSTAGSMLQSSFLGTSGYNQAYFVQTDKSNNVYVYGQTSGKYPITPSGVYSNANSGQFIHEMNPTLSKTIFSTEFGSGRGTPDIAPSAFLVDDCENIYISGWGGALYGYNNSTSSTIGLPVTANAYRSTPNIVNNSYTGNKNNGQDFYFMVLQKQASSLWYATYFGSTGGGNGSLAHVDGGTSRFDKKGVIYQSICGGCGGYSDIPTTPGAWSSQNKSSNCNNAVVKFQMELLETVSSFIINPITSGCVPFITNFSNNSSNANTFKWYFGDGDSSLSNAPTHIYPTPGTYTVSLVATDSLTCNITDTAHEIIHVGPPLTLSAPSAFVCIGDSVVLNTVTNFPATFFWTPSQGLSNDSLANPKASPLGATTYYVTAQDSFCSVTDSLTVSVYKNVTRIIPRTNDICLADSVSLTTDSSFADYSWSTGSTASAIRILNSGPYFVFTTTKQGCKGEDSININAFTQVPLVERDTAICLNKFVYLHADSGNYTYLWKPSTGLNKNDIYNPEARPLTSIEYTVTVTNGPCISTDSVRVRVWPSPYIRTLPDSLMVLPGQTVTLGVTGTPPFNWYPSSGLSCYDCSNPTVNMNDSCKKYYVNVADSDGCVAIDSVVIDVMPTMYIPNAFTPNGDGLNDIFQPKFTGYKSVEVYIFDRWGQLIYHWNTLDGGWDGTCNGVKVQEDTYVYMITAVTYFNTTYQKIGNVTVIR